MIRHARVEAVLTADGPTFVTRRIESVLIDFGGIPGDRHYGLTRQADARDKRFYARGTEVRNRRQITALSVEDCAAIAQNLGLEQVTPEWLGANLLFSGMEGFTLLAPGTRLLFPSGLGLIVEGENKPCRGPGEVIAEAHPGQEKLAGRFVKAAWQKRGIITSVERPGRVFVGDLVQVIPPEETWD